MFLRSFYDFIFFSLYSFARGLTFLYQPPCIVSGLLIFRLFTIDICPFGILHFVPYLPLCIFPFQLYADDNIFCRTLQLALYSRNSCKMKNHCSVSALLDDQCPIKSIITALSRSQQRNPNANKLGRISDHLIVKGRVLLVPNR